MAHDLVGTIVWLAVLSAGLSWCVWVHRRGWSPHSVRDALHVGTSIWVFGWPFWQGISAPTAIVVGAVASSLAFPAIAARARSLDAFVASVTAGEERWTGIVFYVLSYAIWTPVGLLTRPLPAAAALLALAWGDGLGGLAGRKWGRLSYPVLGGKRKTLEGSLAVALLSGLAVCVAAAWFQAPVPAGVVLFTAAAAAVVEGIAPRATDNLALPAVVAGCLFAMA